MKKIYDIPYHIRNKEKLRPEKNKWNKENRKKLQVCGKEVAKREIESNIFWKENIQKPNFNVSISFKLPFSWGVSKNALYHPNMQHRIYLSKEGKDMKELIAWTIKKEKVDWKQTKLYLEIFVEKPKDKGDAINFLDIIADGVQMGTGINDKWYCIERLDWQINKNDPKIWVTIKQDTLNDYIICSYCGRILKADENNFRKRKTKTGFSKVCNDCLEERKCILKR